MTGYPVTAIMMMTAGAHSIQPSLRSARAPSDSGALPFFPGTGAVVSPVTVSVVALIGPFLPSRRARRRLRGGGSRDQALRLQGVVELADHRLLRAGRADAGGRRDQVRDVDGHDLVDG